MLPGVTHTPKSLCKLKPKCLHNYEEMEWLNFNLLMTGFDIERCIKQKMFL